MFNSLRLVGLLLIESEHSGYAVISTPQQHSHTEP